MGGKIKKTLVTIFMSLLVLGLSFGFILSGLYSPGRTVTEKENGVKFRFDSVNNLWIANIEGQQAAFNFLPSETQLVQIEGNPLELLKSLVEIDLTSDLNDTNIPGIALAQHQMQLVLERYGTFVRQGFIEENEHGFPVISCENSTAQIPVVLFRTGNTTKIKEELGCVVVESTPSDILRVKDRLVYGVLEVI